MINAPFGNRRLIRLDIAVRIRLNPTRSWVAFNPLDPSHDQPANPVATQDLLNNIHPELSGVVPSPVHKEGRQQDGFLRLQEIYNLKLQAGLAALSACQSGLGKEIKGEGLVGLARGFMYAGAPRVVASLWKVDDRATAN